MPSFGRFLRKSFRKPRNPIILKDWLGGLDSNQDSQIQSLESYQLDDLPTPHKHCSLRASRAFRPKNCNQTRTYAADSGDLVRSRDDVVAPEHFRRFVPTDAHCL